MFLLAIDLATFVGSVERPSRQLDSLRTDSHVRLPALELTSLADSVEIDADLLRRLEQATRD